MKGIFKKKWLYLIGAVYLTKYVLNTLRSDLPKARNAKPKPAPINTWEAEGGALLSCHTSPESPDNLSGPRRPHAANPPLSSGFSN